MGTISTLDYTDNMAADKKPLLTDLRETLDSLETYINTTVKNNFNQLAQDAFPSGYAFDSDGNKNYTTYNLFDKQTATNNYTGGDITISTTGAWTDLDTSNAQITFTPILLAGDFRLTAQFSVDTLTSNATNEIDVRFRLTDGSTPSTVIHNFRSVSGVTATRLRVPVTLEHNYDALAASAQTIKIQYYIVTQTACTLKVLANSNCPIVITAEKI